MLKVLFSLLFVLTTGFVHSKNDSNGKLAKIKLLETSATLNQKVSVLIYPVKFTGDIALDTIVKAKFENQVVSLERFGDGLWRFKSPVLSVIKSYVFIAEIYIEDKKQADISRTEIKKITEEITQLDYEIQHTSDPVILQQLMNLRDQKVEERTDLINLIDQLRRFVGTENFSFVPVNSQINE